MAWVEKDHNDRVVSTPLLCAGLPATRPGCPEPHPAWPWMPPGMGHPQPPWASMFLLKQQQKNSITMPTVPHEYSGSLGTFSQGISVAAVRGKTLPDVSRLTQQGLESSPTIHWRRKIPYCHSNCQQQCFRLDCQNFLESYNNLSGGDT